DGNMWFTDRGATKQLGEVKVGDAATDWSISLFPDNVPQSSLPGGVRTGPDGNLWYLDNDPAQQKVARYGVDAPAASIPPPTIEGGGGVGVQQTCAGATWASWAGQQPSIDRFEFDGYRWYRDGNLIAGQAEATYTPTPSDMGHTLRCTVTV